MSNSEQQTVIYETERLYVRGLCAADIDGPYFDWLNDPEVCRYNSHGLFPNTRHGMEEFVRSLAGRDRMVWAVLEREDRRHIGNVSLQSISWTDRSAEFAVLLGARDCWGKGYAYEAAVRLFQHGFTRLNLRRIYCGMAAPNIGMQKLALKLKMRHEGTRRQAVFLDGEYHDVLEYGVLREEFGS